MSLITQIMDEETRWLARQEGKLLVDMLDVYKGTIAEIRSEIGALDQGYPSSAGGQSSHNEAQDV